MASISVIVPCHNYAIFLPDAIHSLIGGETCLGNVSPQTFADFEVIIVDDASTDDSRDVAAALSLEDERVSYFTLFRNSGTAAALNAGIEAADGEYIYILSADDLVEPWTLEVMVTASRRHEHHVCYGDMKIVTGGQIAKDWPLTGYSFQKVVAKNPMPAGGVMYPRRCWEEVGGYPEVMRWGREGWAFNVACGLSGWPGQHIGTDCGYRYRWDGQNRSARTSGKGPVTKPPECDTWRQFYRCQIARLYPQLYERGAIDMPCCGEPITKSKSSANTKPAKKSAPATLAGKGGFAIVEYIGPSPVDQTFWVGNTAYSFGKKKVGYVAKDHLAAILRMRGKKKEKLFAEVKAPPPPKKKKKRAAPEPVDTPAQQEKPAVAAPVPVVESKPVQVSKEPEATGAAAALAEAHGIKLSDVQGSGDGGRVLKGDVQAYIAQMEERGVALWVEKTDEDQ